MPTIYTQPFKVPSMKPQTLLLYLVVFAAAAVAAQTTTTAAAAASTTPAPAGDSGLSTTTLIIIVISSIAGALFITGVIVLACYCSKRHKIVEYERVEPGDKGEERKSER